MSDSIHDPAASDGSSENARNGAAKRRDPNEPAAVVGLGASAGGVAVLQQFFSDMDPESGLAFVVVMHLSPEHESVLANVIQQRTSMPVLQVTEPVKVKPNHVYVIPPNHQLAFDDSTLRLVAPQQALGRRVTIDLFFRTLAQAYGQRAVSVILSGTDSDGAIGLKHVRAQGGVTIAQDPSEAEHDSMPTTAISTGMVDWVLPVSEMAAKLMEFVRNENAMKLPPELPESPEPNAKDRDAPGGETISEETRTADDESALNEVLAHLRSQTGHDFTHYRRATILRRIARRLQVNSLETIPHYLAFLRQHPAEARALLQDLLVGVTHFFRDQESFAALEANIPQLFAGKDKNDQVRVWVAGCATGEEAYSIAMLLCEYAEKLESPPGVQVLASDIDEQAIQESRDGVYPTTIEADVSQERLRHFFNMDHGHYRVRRRVREKVLFAAHNVLSDAPFSRLDLVSCRNLLIYLNPKAQEQVFDIFHFALRSGGLLFIGGSESSTVQGMFSAVDPKHRIYVRRSVPRPAWKLPMLPLRTAEPGNRPHLRLSSRKQPLSVLDRGLLVEAGTKTHEALFSGQQRRAALFGELHLKLLEQYAPPSIVVNEEHEIVHLSAKAGRFLRFTEGEPSMNLLQVILPELQIELRTALFRASQTETNILGAPQTVRVEGENEAILLQVRRIESEQSEKFYLVLFAAAESAQEVAAPTLPGDVTRDLDAEIQHLKQQLSSTVEQYEAGSEELKASNEELQAINEEMRSATEELETSKEELQSVNEELTTVNNELKNSIEDLSQSNSDLNNLMASSDIGTLFLNRQLRIQRFTPAAQKIFNLIPSDLDRPISDITSTLKYKGFIDDAQKVLQDLHTVEREVQLGDGTWFLSRIAPYRTSEDRIAGVVATFIDIARRKKAEDALRDSEAKFRILSDTAPALIWFNDPEGNNQYVNQQYLDFTGKTAEEISGKRWQLIIHPDDLPLLVANYEAAVSEQRRFHAVVRARRHDGEWRWVESVAHPLFDSGGVYLGHVGVSPDITDRKEAEEALRASEGRLQRMVNVAGVGVMTFDASGVILHANDALIEMLGYEREEFEKQTLTWREFTPPEHMAATMEIMEQLHKTGRGGPYEKEYFRKDGTRKWMMFVGADLGDGTTVKYAIDISDRKRAEEAARASEERVRTISDNVPQLIWTNDAEGTANYFNKRWFDYTGLSHEESYGLGWQAIVHPEDEPAAIERWKRALVKGEVFDAEYRLRGKDGQYRWFIGRNVPINNGTGGVFSWFGSATDIDELKAVEKALRSTEERFRLLVEGAKDYAMFLLDLDNRITFWSNGAQRVFGWTEAEAVGQTGALIFVPEDVEKGAVEEEIVIAMNKGRAPDRRWHLRKDGSRIWVDGVMTRIDDADGAPRGLAKIARDATDLREAEDELRHAKDEMEQRVIERTQDVLATNAELERTMAQRQQLERELLEISEREKRRIGEDLHDMVCQELTATALYLKSSAKQLAKESPPASATLDEAAETVNQNVVLARELARGLQAVEITPSGLKNSLRDLAAQASQTAGVKCLFRAGRGVRVYDDDVALHLYRIAQEAVTNALKHSGAKNVLISLDHDKTHVCISIQDDGKGFVPKKRSKGKGLGLHMMRYRANALGGELKVAPRRTGGMEIICSIPLKQPGRAAPG
ncbi:MAG TPA: PAS domain S-box protein [Chthoniobacterales bacterium]|nr:PAS domain S-box protein [Chthoniobacterales bacterium]